MKHPIKARLIVGLIMLVLAFLGLIVTDLWKNGAWNYWRYITPVFAILSLGLSFKMRRESTEEKVATLWHEVAQWLGLLGAVWLMSAFVKLGLIGRFEASMQVLVLLALTVFTNGIYTEHSFIIVGIVLGLLAAVVALVNEYLFAIMLPTIIIGIGILVWLFHRKKKAG